MKTGDDFETFLSRQPFRPPPAEWKAGILRAARAPAAPGESDPAPPAAERAPRRSAFAALFWPSPYAWGGLAALWLALLALKWDTPAAPVLAAGRTPTPPSEFGRVVARQQEKVGALLAMSLPPLRHAHRPPPRPASDPLL